MIFVACALYRFHIQNIDSTHLEEPILDVEALNTNCLLADFLKFLLVRFFGVIIIFINGDFTAKNSSDFMDV